MKRKALRSLGLLVVLACTTTSDAPKAQNAVLGGDVVARVGSVSIEKSLVERVARERRITPREALDLLVDDALLAEGARARGLDQSPRVRFDHMRARARWVADGIEDRAVARGLPSDEEVEAITKKHWQSVDAPSGLRAVHAVVLREKAPSIEGARALAETIEAAVTEADSAQTFGEKAKAVPKNGFSVRIEMVPAFARDGRVLEGGGMLDAAFVAGVYAMSDQHRDRGIVESQFGWHVVYVVGLLPEKRVPFEERRLRFADEAVFLRGKAEKDALIASSRKGTTIVIDPAADALMTSAVTGRP